MLTGSGFLPTKCRKRGAKYGETIAILASGKWIGCNCAARGNRKVTSSGHLCSFSRYIDFDRSKLYVGLPLKIHGMNQKFVDRIAIETEEIKAAGLYKSERIITSPQGAEIEVGGKTVLNFCANNYL